MRKALLLLALPTLLAAQALPRIVRQDGQYQFLVDGEPMLDPRANGVARNTRNERASLIAVS